MLLFSLYITPITCHGANPKVGRVWPYLCAARRILGSAVTAIRCAGDGPHTVDPPQSGRLASCSVGVQGPTLGVQPQLDTTA